MGNTGHEDKDLICQGIASYLVIPQFWWLVYTHTQSLAPIIPLSSAGILHIFIFKLQTK